MQIRFYGKTYSFNTKAELGRVLDDIYYQYQDLRREIPRKYEQKIDSELQKLETDVQETYRTVRNMEDDLKNSKGENMNYYAKLAEEKRNSTVARGTIHGHKYEVDRMSDGSYMGYVYDYSDFPIYKTGLHSTVAGAEKEIKSKVFNSKGYYEKLVEEKKQNADTAEEVKRELNRMGWWRDIEEFIGDAKSAGYSVFAEGIDWAGLSKDGKKWHVRVSGTEGTKKVTSVSPY